MFRLTRREEREVVTSCDHLRLDQDVEGRTEVKEVPIWHLKNLRRESGGRRKLRPPSVWQKLEIANCDLKTRYFG